MKKNLPDVAVATLFSNPFGPFLVNLLLQIDP